MKNYKLFPLNHKYRVSICGSIQTNYRTGSIGTWRDKGTTKTCSGYVKTTLNVGGKNSAWYVHRIVFLTYGGDLIKGHDVNHINGNKQNNHFKNLEQITHKENMRHAYSKGLADPKRIGDWSHENFGSVRNDALIILHLNGFSQSDIATALSCTQPHVSQYIKRYKEGKIRFKKYGKSIV